MWYNQNKRVVNQTKGLWKGKESSKIISYQKKKHLTKLIIFLHYTDTSISVFFWGIFNDFFQDHLRVQSVS